ncbi:MAG: hypothetical protein IJT20_04985 [Synergistaceae bacterium]|nr:hypothetical protein [Synergistaceae bacterium]
MRGIVLAATPAAVVAHLENGEFALIELLGGYDVERGDILEGNLADEGSHEITNLTQLEDEMSVVVQRICRSFNDAISRIW